MKVLYRNVDLSTTNTSYPTLHAFHTPSSIPKVLKISHLNSRKAQKNSIENVVFN